jgi:hypothetical protein
MGRLSIEVGDGPLEELTVPLAVGIDLSGEVEAEGEGKEFFKNSRVWLNPVDEFVFGPQPNVEVKEDGSFAFSGVLPGTWDLNYGIPIPNGYVKSVMLGDQEIHGGHRLTISPSSSGPLRIIMGTKPAHIEGVVAGLSGGIVGVLVALVPVDDSSGGPGPLQNVMTDPQGRFTLMSVPPGEYRIYALEGGDWATMQNSALLKALEDRSEPVTLAEGEQASKQLSLIPASVITQAEDALE